MVRTPIDRRARRFGASLLLACACLAGAGPAAAQNVFACEPEWAALARVLLPRARVFAATHAGQDPHHIEARPALIAALRSADLAVCTGAGLEAGWLPMLQQRSGNPKVQDGAPGLFLAADQVGLLDARPGAVANPFQGDVHAEGNPHLHADPHRLLAVAGALSARLQALLPGQKQAIVQRHAEFEAGWKARIKDWERQTAPLKGRAVAAQHGSHRYLWHWLGIEQSADLEPQPGMAPTPGHLQRLLAPLRASPPMAIVVSSYQDPRSARWLAAQLGGSVPVLALPATVPDADQSDALGAWFDQMLAALLGAAGR